MVFLIVLEGYSVFFLRSFRVEATNAKTRLRFPLFRLVPPITPMG